MEPVGWLIVLGMLAALVWWGTATWNGYQKGRRIVAEGTVTSITWTDSGSGDFIYDYVKEDMDFEFYVGGQRWTGHKTVHGDLAWKNKGDSILVYYLPEDPGRGWMLEA